ncbi:proline-rich transmembrane protein 2 isoform X2 [Embiotoca jacksoni]|uniref:proline-rich transmembrane protein 2 isoform X2 n=1 Tax=Embiotoca jacksoni TaxID=100190 RepID=UPI003703F891
MQSQLMGDGQVRLHLCNSTRTSHSHTNTCKILRAHRAVNRHLLHTPTLEASTTRQDQLGAAVSPVDGLKLGRWISPFLLGGLIPRTGQDRTGRSRASIAKDSSIDDFSDTDSESNFPLMIPQDYLGLAFFSMLCCFWPLGIAAFYLSQKTNKASAQGDFQGANAASRQALWLSVLSIVFGIITYICAIAALISYLSAKPP